MPLVLPRLEIFRALTSDGWILFGTRTARLFAYGLLSPVLVLYLKELGLTEGMIGLLLTLTLLGDTVISLGLTTTADRVGRRQTLFVGALLMVFAGVVFALTSDFWLLLLAATIGVISPSGNEVGPFLSVEQAALSEIVPNERRIQIFAWYNLIGSLATAAGALCGGALTQLLQSLGISGPDSYRPLAIAYGAIGVLLALGVSRLTPAAEVANRRKQEPRTNFQEPRTKNQEPNSKNQTSKPFRFLSWFLEFGSWKLASASFGLHRSLPVVLRLSGLFALDAFGGGFIIQSVLAYWFYLRFDVEPATIGAIFFGANLLAGVSALTAAWVAERIGLVNTMVFTHLPSNILLLLVPLMPTLPLAILMLLLRFAISQMDVPTRQAYTMAVVSPDERSAASGVTGVARSIGAAISPMFASMLMGSTALISVPIYLAGGIKILYDLLLYRAFKTVKVSEQDGGKL